jgi:hypothetical protein
LRSAKITEYEKVTKNSDGSRGEGFPSSPTPNTNPLIG